MAQQLTRSEWLTRNSVLRVRHAEHYRVSWMSWLGGLIHSRRKQRLIVSAILLIFLAFVAAMRWPMVTWSEAEVFTRIMLGRGDAHLWMIVGLQLLWGLPGLLAFFALGAGGAPGSPSLRSLLPIGERDLTLAEMAGRGIAAAKFIAAGLVLQPLLALLLVQAGAASKLPPLLDSWSLAAIPAFLAVFGVQALAERAGRRLYPSAGKSVTTALSLLAWIPFAMTFTRINLVRTQAYALPPLLAGAALLVVALAWTVWLGIERIRAGRPMPVAEFTHTQPSRPRWYLTDLLPPIAALGLMQPGGLAPKLPWLKRALQLALTIFVALMALGTVMELGTAGWAWVTGGEPDRISLLTGPTVAQTIGMVLVASTGILVWTELLSPRYAQERDPADQAHIGFQLPVSWRRVWWGRLGALLASSVLLLAATLATRVATLALYTRLGGNSVDYAAHLHGLLVVAPAALAFSLTCFALIALYRPLARQRGASSGTMTGLLALGGVAGFGTLLGTMVITMDARFTGALESLPPFAVPTMSLALPVMLLVVSWWLVRPGAWSPAPDGVPRATMPLRVSALMATAFVAGFWLGALLMPAIGAVAD